MKRSSLTPWVLGLSAAVFGCSNSASSSGDNGGASNPSGGHPGAAGAGHGAGNTGLGGATSVAGAGNGAGAGNVAGAGNGAGAGNVGGASSTGGTGTGGGNSGGAGAPPAAGAGGGLGAFTGINFGPVSDGGTVTYQNIGAIGQYPSVCSPTGNACCKQPLKFATDKLTPWDQELIMTLRGPLDIKQFAAYQPTVEGQPSGWKLVSSWDVRTPTAAKGVMFTPDDGSTPAFKGPIGSVCLVQASTDKLYGCGTGSSPYCSSTTRHKYAGWAGSKLFVMLASAPHVGSGGITEAQSCKPASNTWTDAPWFGLSVGELIRAGAFSGCNCYEGTPGDFGRGCGQINALEVINDGNSFKNLDVWVSSFFSYGGIVNGQCGNCNAAAMPANVDLLNGPMAATQGAVGSQKQGAGYLRRNATGFRYVVFLLDVSSRTVQYALIHPQNVPPALSTLLPNLPDSIPQATVDSVLALRLPH